MGLSRIFNLESFKPLLMSLGLGITAMASPAAAQSMDSYMSVEKTEPGGKNDMVASWRDMVEKVKKQKSIGPLDRETFSFVKGQDKISIDANFMGADYAERVEEMANYYIEEYGADPYVVASAIKASIDVGIDATFVMKTIEVECSWDFKRRPPKGSAQGPGLLDGAWTDISRKYGKQYGFSFNTSRQNPYWGSLGAALYVKDSIEYIRNYHDGDIEPVMIRNSYFWGNAGNRKVTKLYASQPDAPARKYLSAEYENNPRIVVGTIRDTVLKVAGKVSDLEIFEETPPHITFAVTDKKSDFMQSLKTPVILAMNDVSLADWSMMVPIDASLPEIDMITGRKIDQKLEF